jgi:hypothetical protein
MKGLCQTALKRHEWWWKDLEASPRMSGEERLLLARHLNDEQWDRVITADFMVTLVLTNRGVVGADEPAEIAPNDDALLVLGGTIAAINDGLDALRPLTGQSDDSLKRPATEAS